MIKGLYIHIPFCKRICLYCDFCKMVAPKSMQRDYISALIQELHLYKNRYQHLQTIYIGGGTPSSLSLEVLELLLIELSKAVKIASIKEFTIEANVSDINEDFIKLIKSYGVNRLSIGIQSSNNQLLELIKRDHTRNDIFRVHALLIKHGLNNYNFDFIHSIPNQTEEDILNDLEVMKELKPPHISYYSLIIEERTELKHLLDKGLLKPIDEDTDYEYSILVRKQLQQMGYKNYETSNYCIEGYESNHNLLYWNLDEYIGIGLSSASQYDNRRMKNVTRISKYLEQASISKFQPVEEEFNPESEFVILGLRKSEGISLPEFRNRFKQDLMNLFPVIDKHINNGLLKLENNRLFFSEKGKDLANQVYIDII